MVEVHMEKDHVTKRCSFQKLKRFLRYVFHQNYTWQPYCSE